VSDLCGCFPAPAELARLAENAQAGRSAAFVGTGSPDTVLACQHGSWLLLVALAEAAAQAALAEASARACTGTTKDGAACKGRAGEDGRCAAHKEDS